MIRKLAAMFAFVFLAFGLLAPSALAAVSYYPDTGGFVGRGDVITALGKNALANPAFTYVSTDTYEFDCEWYTGPTVNRTRHEVSRTTSINVDSVVQIDETRKNKQQVITGYFLSQIEIGSGDAPTPECEASKTLVAGSLELISSSGGLHVSDGVQTVALPNTP